MRMMLTDEVNDALQRARSTESTILLGDFNTHIEQTVKHGKA